jgi:hypothetical protein
MAVRSGIEIRAVLDFVLGVDVSASLDQSDNRRRVSGLFGSPACHRLVRGPEPADLRPR